MELYHDLVDTGEITPFDSEGRTEFYHDLVDAGEASGQALPATTAAP